MGSRAVQREGRCGVRYALARSPHAGAGFTIIDVLVSIAVIAVLVGLLLPSLAGVREATRKVICSSNIRQSGLALQMFAGDHRDDLPQSVFAKSTPATSNPERMIMLRLGESLHDWDGLGVLHHQDYMPGPGVYYCPSHTGTNPMPHAADAWTREYTPVIGNYQYRGAFVLGQTLNLRRLDPFVGLVTDGLASISDYNHRVGANVLNADLAVFWFQDDGRVRQMLPDKVEDSGAGDKVLRAWTQIDRAQSGSEVSAMGPGPG